MWIQGLEKEESTTRHASLLHGGLSQGADGVLITGLDQAPLEARVRLARSSGRPDGNKGLLPPPSTLLPAHSASSPPSTPSFILNPLRL